MLTIKCFRVLQDVNYPTPRWMWTNMSYNVRPVDFSFNTTSRLSQELAKQCLNELDDLNRYVSMCQTPSFREEHQDLHWMEVGSGPTKDRYHWYGLTSEQLDKTCENLEKVLPDYQEIYDRDYDAFRQEDFDVQLYANVLLLDNVYLGHIYTWISPNDPNYCFCMGIRSTVKSIPNKYLGKRYPSVTKILLESVRIFALKNNATKVIIAFPLSVMLDQEGFVRKPVRTSLLGKSISPRNDSICYSCQTLTDIYKPISQEEITFYYIRPERIPNIMNKPFFSIQDFFK